MPETAAEVSVVAASSSSTTSSSSRSRSSKSSAKATTEAKKLRPVTLVRSRADVLEPPAFASRDGVSNAWKVSRVVCVRIDSKAKSRSALTAASRALDELLSDESHDGGTFLRRFADAARKATTSLATKEIVFGWAASSTQRSKKTGKTIEVPRLSAAHSRLAPNLLAHLEGDFLRPILTKLWALHRAVATYVPTEADFGLGDLGASPSASLGYPDERVGWNKLLLHVDHITDDTLSPSSSHIDACDAVSTHYYSWLIFI